MGLGGAETGGDAASQESLDSHRTTLRGSYYAKEAVGGEDDFRATRRQSRPSMPLRP